MTGTGSRQLGHSSALIRVIQAVCSILNMSKHVQYSVTMSDAGRVTGNQSNPDATRRRILQTAARHFRAICKRRLNECQRETATVAAAAAATSFTEPREERSRRP